MATAIESGIGTLNFNKQSAKGTMATAASTAVGTNRPRVFDEGLKSGKKLGSEEYLDGQRFASPSQFVDATGGEVGSVTIQVQPENAGLFHAQLLGVDTVTGASDPYTHTITSAGASGGYGTWWEDVGSAVREREVYWDTKIAKSTLECGQDQKVMHQSMDLMSLKPAEIYTTNPTKAEDTSDPYIWTQVQGAVTIDSATINEVEGEILEIDTAMEVFWGDSQEPLQLIEKKGKVSRTAKCIVTDVTQQKMLKVIYNNTAPTAGTRPVNVVTYFGIQTVYTASASRTLTINTPRVAVKPDDLAIDAQREGGKMPLVFTGDALKNGATPALTITALSADATTYV